MEVAFQPTRRKRGNNEGSIRKRRDGRWEAQYSVKRQSDGKTVRRSLYGKSRQEVQEKLQEVLVSIHQDEYIEPSRITVGQWLYHWLRVYYRLSCLMGGPHDRDKVFKAAESHYHCVPAKS